MTEPRGNVLPIYFVADESGSMAPNIGELNTGLVSLLDAMHTESMAAAKVRFSIVGFADDTIPYLSLVDLRDIESMPALAARGTTSYRAAFTDLYARINDDVQTLRDSGYLVNRPAVFFLTDGMPNDGEDWRGPLNALKSPDFKRRPNILAFGIGEANAAIIAEIASNEQFGFLAAKGSDTGTAIAKFCKMLTQSVVSSGQALASGNAVLQGEKPEGFKMAVDLLD